jgi:hypothetical protein
VLPALKVGGSGGRANRLDLARWLVSAEHPLTARVAVNRFWQMVFGTGIVESSDNFGRQGGQPSHPELLDWLAREFIDSGWDVKRMVRLLVTSGTYRQSSQASPERLAGDPSNVLLARGPARRLTAEMLRDQALAVSGLLAERVGGSSVRPYQPEGLWEVAMNAPRYDQSHGPDLYRRSLYTFWKRTVPPPSLQTFDAPEREYCVVRRLATNTPLQALVLLNDPTYVEASRKLAERLLRETPDSVPARVAHAYALVLGRAPTAAEAKTLARLYNRSLSAYRADRAAAEKLLSVGESPRDKTADPAILAAWATVAGALLNTDEAITRG